MKKESGFSSKKVDELKSKKRKKSVKIPEPKKNNEFFGNQGIKQDLQSFYNSEAKKYTETRKKFWHEEKAILDAITPLFNDVISNECEKSTGQMECNTHIDPHASFHSAQDDKSTQDSQQAEQASAEFTPLSGVSEGQNKKIKVLEFGCGSGRFASLLNQIFPGKFDYVGIDLSDELLSYASKENPNLTFFQGDITKLVKNFEQESFDLIVGTSSFQHIPTAKERSFLMKNFYRLLDYDGMLLMTNRSLSDWFIKKHRKIVMKAKVLSRFKGNSRDLMVPRTDENGKVYERFYHFFSLKELENLSNFAGLTLRANTFLDGDGNFINNEKISRSSFFVATKTPVID